MPPRAKKSDHAPRRGATARGPAFVPEPIRRALDPGQDAPKVAQVAYFAVLGGLAAAEIVEWPIAVLMAAGHVLMRSRNPIVREAGEGLDDA